MMRKKKILKTMIACILACCFCLTGCGADISDKDTESQSSGVELALSPESTSSPELTPSPQLSPDEYFRQPMPEQYIPEGKEIVTLGTFIKQTISSKVYMSVTAFNQAQDKYFVKIERYNSYDNFLLDIARKQGTDLYDLYLGVSVDDLVRKGILEDLTSYFDSSDAVGREDVVDAVWCAGSTDDKMYLLIPCFRCNGIIVEKGYTKEGAWSGRDYLDMGKKYPGSRLSNGIEDPTGQFLSELREYMGSFINWEDRTCSFDSNEFMTLLEDLKTLSSYSYEAVDSSATLADLIRGKTYLTKFMSLNMDHGLYSYRNVKDAFGEGYEIAGVPTADGSLKYMMVYDQMYGMNAASEKKEGAWAFLEYLLSEEYQKPDLPTDGSAVSSMLSESFPARKDSLEQGLQANVDFVTGPNDRIVYVKNGYTNERQEGYDGFTEEDKKAVLRIIDNTYRSSFSTDYTLLNILSEETAPFFQGQKSVQDVVKIIQSRVSLYLAE